MPTISEIILTNLSQLTEFYDHDDLNRVLGEIQANIRKVSGLITTSRIGQGVFAFDVAIDPAVKVGQPVFYNTTTNRFERSKLTILVGAGGRTYAGPESEAWGLVSEKCAGDRAHLLISGLASISLLDSAGVASPAGKFYLSTAAGRLENSVVNSLIVPVLLATGTGDVIFRPWFADTFPRYTPAMVELVTAPAGTATNVGNISTITAANPLNTGWLPATHSVFGGLAPAGAKFGYNWKRDAQLQSGWPPINPAAATIFFDVGGGESSGYRSVVSDGERLTINANGIWWMQDTVGQTPWTYLSEGATSGSRPHPQSRRMYLEADLTVQGTELRTGVTSLTSTIPWLDTVSRGTNSAATVGDVALQLDLVNMFESLTDVSGVALKGFANSKFLAGPVVAELYPGDSTVTLSGTRSAGGGYIGAVTISVNSNKEFDLLPTDSQLFGATMEAYGDLIAIGLPPSRTSSFVNAFHVPASVSANAKLRFVLWLTGPQTYTVPASITLGTRVFTRPSGAAVTIPTEGSLALTVPASTSVAAGKYIELVSADLTVSGGDTVYLRITRTGSGDGVGSEMHILKNFAVFV